VGVLECGFGRLPFWGLAHASRPAMGGRAAQTSPEGISDERPLLLQHRVPRGEGLFNVVTGFSRRQLDRPAMTKLILVKHAAPQILRDVISSRWVLSDAGRRRCDWLANELSAQGVSRICSSLEPKALETAALVAVRLGLVIEPCHNLHENDRTGLGFVTRDELWRRLREFFQHPARITIGNETANNALQRFAESIGDIVSKGHGQPSAVVTHGTVLSLFVAHHNAIAPFDLWSRLGLPSYVVLDANSFSFDGAAHNCPDQG
jgi:broad specificity phosphatase PhoE